ncbi:hypothetical protein [Prochlorococcus marinus]|uniref:Uncharacterized protein n=1 Tax=Prochlorococcus marinus XMU1408 TaxID=2213228 RepID=A0A318R1S1_PROMR|nr:hypothetical protein [Prochlorococcus marinus]MBW3041114.1 hypothetical protein [Prochlorococcus marinus str. XMU1408]PYE03716.1 hypothetical protein DNJ73_00580 [Prochlorococcus marinus XMU1408]
MKTTDKKNHHRWVLLRHIGAPDDLRGIHFDLLIEDKEYCRTWRLNEIPIMDGPYVQAVYIAPHNLDWLFITEKAVSGNRGVATRVKKGIFFNSLPNIENNFINLSLQWENEPGDLLIDKNGCRILRKNSKYCL